ncbi:hypothetical protein [Winogradskyella tangerina]|uniref:hypothetical protein n=1 Tax=Winogradskyella tangerina TaxID=2023240 RepID=UPI000DBE7B9B|nr:hypothetical protein [Winogradskyella tangerina]
MKHKILLSLSLIISCLLLSCSEDELELNNQNAETVSECDLNIVEDTLIALCTDGSNTARPDQVLTISASFYSKGDNPSNTVFTWTISSGSMEILSNESIIDNENSIARSVVTIRLNSDFTGDGVINVLSENNSGSATMNHLVELDASE